MRWVCKACGKTSTTRTGWNADFTAQAERESGWDESCMSNAVYCEWTDRALFPDAEGVFHLAEGWVIVDPQPVGP